MPYPKFMPSPGFWTTWNGDFWSNDDDYDYSDGDTDNKDDSEDDNKEDDNNDHNHEDNHKDNIKHQKLNKCYLIFCGG